MVAASCVLSLSAQSIDITVALDRQGNADITEIWDFTADRGTEVYLVRDNLDDIGIYDLRVWDGDGTEFVNEGEWDTDRSISQKAGKCGIVHKRNGVELCWGLGNYGPHRFTVKYKMTNVVRAMDDFDAFHLQLVSPGVQPRPDEVKVRITASHQPFDDQNTGIWAFGYEGSINFQDGAIVAETDSPFTSDEYSVIVLARFNKEIFEPASHDGGAFQEKLDEAFKGSTYQDYLDKEQEETRGVIGFLASLLTIFGITAVTAKRAIRKRNLKMFGLERIKDIGYERELPFGGDLLATRYILSKCGRTGSESAIASALILQMVKNKYIVLAKNEKGDVELAFNPERNIDELNPSEKEFYLMLKEASGNDLILQKKEFPRWSKANQATVSDWVKDLPQQGAANIRDKGMLKKGEYTPEGQLNARRAFGFKKYLTDFTLIAERGSSELPLWQDYLIYGALYGIADKIAKELKDIDPKAFEETFGYDYPTLHRVLYLSNNMSSSIMSAVVREQNARSTSGHGGFSSFGGGGGFHGGGFGGGVR